MVKQKPTSLAFSCLHVFALTLQDENWRGW